MIIQRFVDVDVVISVKSASSNQQNLIVTDGENIFFSDKSVIETSLDGSTISIPSFQISDLTISPLDISTANQNFIFIYTHETLLQIDLSSQITQEFPISFSPPVQVPSIHYYTKESQLLFSGTSNNYEDISYLHLQPNVFFNATQNLYRFTINSQPSYSKWVVDDEIGVLFLFPNDGSLNVFSLDNNILYQHYTGVLSERFAGVADTNRSLLYICGRDPNSGVVSLEIYNYKGVSKTQGISLVKSVPFKAEGITDCLAAASDLEQGQIFFTYYDGIALAILGIDVNGQNEISQSFMDDEAITRALYTFRKIGGNPNSNAITIATSQRLITMHYQSPCKNDCSLNGKCNYLVCECFPGYTLNDCSQAIPTVVSVSQGSYLQPTTIEINGTNFIEGFTSVGIDIASCENVVVLSPTTLHCTFNYNLTNPHNTSYDVTVYVKTLEATLPTSFTYLKPSVKTAAINYQTETVLLQGENLLPVSAYTVELNSQLLQCINGNSSSIECILTSDQTSGNIVLGDGGFFPYDPLSVIITPVVREINPLVLPTTATNITIVGSFFSGSQIKFGGQVVQPLESNSSSFVITSPDGIIPDPNKLVSVFNVDGSSKEFTFTYQPPTFNSYKQLPGQMLNIIGTNFGTSSSIVYVQLLDLQVNATINSVSHTLINVLLPPYSPAGQFIVNVDGKTIQFPVNFKPEITDIQPYPNTKGGSTVLITGNNLNPNSISSTIQSIIGQPLSCEQKVNASFPSEVYCSIPSGTGNIKYTATSIYGTNENDPNYKLESTFDSRFENPSISRITPNSINFGQTVDISIVGDNFINNQTLIQVSIHNNNTNCNIKLSSTTLIVCTLKTPPPPSNNNEPQPPVSVQVIVDGLLSNLGSITYTFSCPGTPQCSGRGVCKSNGECQCNPGFTGNDCSSQSTPTTGGNSDNGGSTSTSSTTSTTGGSGGDTTSTTTSSTTEGSNQKSIYLTDGSSIYFIDTSSIPKATNDTAITHGNFLVSNPPLAIKEISVSNPNFVFYYASNQLVQIEIASTITKTFPITFGDSFKAPLLHYSMDKSRLYLSSISNDDPAVSFISLANNAKFEANSKLELLTLISDDTATKWISADSTIFYFVSKGNIYYSTGQGFNGYNVEKTDRYTGVYDSKKKMLYVCGSDKTSKVLQLEIYSLGTELEKVKFIPFKTAGVKTCQSALLEPIQGQLFFTVTTATDPAILAIDINGNGETIQMLAGETNANTTLFSYSSTPKGEPTVYSVGVVTLPSNKIYAYQYTSPCKGGCSGRGTCEALVCKCPAGYGLDDCSQKIPTVTSVTGGVYLRATKIEITGTDFFNGTITVKIEDKACVDPTFKSETTIECTFTGDFANPSTSSYDLLVDITGLSARLNDSFTFKKPKISGAKTTDPFTINGENLLPFDQYKVMMGEQELTCKGGDEKHLECNLPNFTGLTTIPNVTVSDKFEFKYDPVAIVLVPIVTEIKPTILPVTPTNVTITGSNFLKPFEVHFGDKIIEPIESSDTLIIIKSTDEMVQDMKIYVSTVDGKSKEHTFTYEKRIKIYKSDWEDGVKSRFAISKTIATSIFLFFACLLPSIAFGVHNQENTDGKFSVAKTLVSQGIGGMIFAVFSGHPMVVLLSTAPLAIFIKITFEIARDNQLDFWSLYAMIGLFNGLFLIAYSVLGMSKLLRKYNSRFVEETFALFITIAFLYDGIKPIVVEFIDHVYRCGSGGCQPTEPLLILILAILSFWICFKLSNIDRSNLFGTIVRMIISDYALFLGVLLSSVIRHSIFRTLDLTTFPTNLNDIISTDFKGLSSPGYYFLALALGFLLSLLFFIDQVISSSLASSPHFNLKKWPGINQDLLVVAFINILFSFLGLPWIHGALPHSSLHVRSLASIQLIKNKFDNYTTEKFISVIETRISGMLSRIKALTGNHFWDRLVLMITDRNLYPHTLATRIYAKVYVTVVVKL
eukprot:gene8645-10642_t